MNRLSYNIDALANLGKRWFAKPPEGFAPPSKGAIESFSIYATLMHKSALGEQVMKRILEEPEPHYSAHMGYIYMAQKWMTENGPTIFMSEQILNACENTEAFKGVEGSDIKTTYPIGYLSLPKGRGFISKQTGDRLGHIWFTILEKNDKVPFLLNNKVQYLKTQDFGRKLFLQGYWDKSQECSSFSLPLDDSGVSLYDTLERARHKLCADNHVSRITSTEVLLEEAKDLGLWIGSLAINLMLIMQSYPQYLEKLSAKDSARQNFKDKEPPTSIIIRPSKSQPILRTVENETDEFPSEPTGKTVGNHWRRGHWRRQPHGEYWELQNPEVQVVILPDKRHAHMRWILPIYVGLVEKEKAAS